VSSDQDHIVDTVVLLYFLLVDEVDLLSDLIGTPLRVPVAVYDPEDRSVPAEALRHSELLSEMHQSIRHYEVSTRTGSASSDLLDRVLRVNALYESGALTVVEMAKQEAILAARLQSRSKVADYGLRVPLGAGEAACVAIAWERGWTVTTDDEAALRVLDKLHGDRTYAYERIRKLLMRAADEDRITESSANEIHTAMRDLGFWDSGAPFPDA